MAAALAVALCAPRGAWSQPLDKGGDKGSDGGDKGSDTGDKGSDGGDKGSDAGGKGSNAAEAAPEKPKAAGPASPGVAFLGLTPLKNKGGPEDIVELKNAQRIRATLEQSLSQALHKPVIGDSQMRQLLSPSYLVGMIQCAGNLSCLFKLVTPLKSQGFDAVMLGDYYVDSGTHHFHILQMSLDTGAVEKEAAIDLSGDALDKPNEWTPGLAPFVQAQVGKIVVSLDPPGATCRIDREPCKFENDDGKTIVLPLGDHELEISKDGFEPLKQPVTVELGITKQVPIKLVPLAAGEGELRVPPALGRRAPSLPAVRTDSPPKIDGQLDDPVWEKGWVDPNFTQNFPDEGKQPTQKTELRVLYDDTAIYVGVRCFDSEPKKIIARLTRRDRDVDSDKVMIDISSKNDRSSAYHFQVSAAGVQVDGIRFNDTDYGDTWDGRWYTSTTIDDKGWTAELKIPLSTLRYNGDVNQFGFQVRRNIARLGETDEWSYVPRTAKGEVSYYGAINGLKGLQAKRLFDILMYSSRRYSFRRNQGVLDGTIQTNEIGADLKVGLTPALTLNGTINPDFGTVEVDQKVLNLSTVETYFPEKRPFFLEGAELFSTPFNLFYSRRIGAKPPAPALSGQAFLVEPQKDGRILGAMNMSGVLSGRTSVAVLDAVTDSQYADIRQGMGNPRETRLVDPLTNFGILRLRNEFGSNNAVGLLATSVNRIEEKNLAAPNPDDLCPVPYSTDFASLVAPTPKNGRCTNDAYTGGADMRLKSASGEYGVTGQVLGSFIKNGPDRFIPDGTTIGDGAKGFAMMLEAGRYGGDTHWLYDIRYKNATPRLQINDAGYLGTANFHQIFGDLIWRTTHPVGPFLSFSTTAHFEHFRDWHLKDNTNFGPDIMTNMQFTNFWNLIIGSQPYFIRYVENRETQDGARTQRPHGWYVYGSISTNPNKSVVYSTNASSLGVYGNYRGLVGLDASAQLSLKPTTTLELDIATTYDIFNNNPRSIGITDNGDGTSTYLFQELDYQAINLTVRGTYTLSTKVSLQAYAQTLLDHGIFNHSTEATVSGKQPLITVEDQKPSSEPSIGGFRDGTVNLNVFLRWEYLPASALWFVYTHSQLQTPFDSMMESSPKFRLDRFSGGETTDVVLAKLTYLWY